MKNDVGQGGGHGLNARPSAGESKKSGVFSSPLGRVGSLFGLILVIVVAWLLLGGGPGSQVFKIYITKGGVYRVTYEELREVGLKSGRINSDAITLTHRDDEIPIWVSDGDDGRFGPGDRIEFVGEQLKGHRSHHNEYTLLNVYQLALDSTRQGQRMSVPQMPDPSARPEEPVHLETEMHVEMNNFMVHFSAPGGESPEPRFWVRMSSIDPEPFRHEFRLGRCREGAKPISLAVELRGWSTASRRSGGVLSDHRVDLYFNGQLIGFGEWDGRTSHVIEVPEVPEELVKPEALNVLELKVPSRRLTNSPDPLIDMVLLNWIEIRHPPPEAGEEFGGSWISPNLQRFYLSQPLEADAHAAVKVRLTSVRGSAMLVYGNNGLRFDGSNMEVEDHEGTSLYHFYPPAQESVFFVAQSEDSLLPPVGIELERPSGLKETSHQADYIIIAHPRLLEAVEPLADLHRRRGLEVSVVAVDDVYDEFSDSIVHPDAIRDFLKFAYHEWQRPAPRLVLLVGDASWDAEGIGTVYKDGAPYTPGLPLSHRNLIPTSAFEEGFRGHSASDNFFVSVDGDDYLPDMAIGRFPVVEPEEVEAIVNKSIRYAAEADVGPWRRNILWLSDESPLMQDSSDSIAQLAEEQGFASLKLYPSKDGRVTELTQNPLREALDRGLVLVHFFGHGARYVWRTGAASIENNFDLFTFDDLNELKPTAKMPLVLSMTCWSAPFDHPTADSIGENFIRLAERGAIGFLGASWKVSSNPELSELLIEELTSPGAMIGEAILRAKRRLDKRGLVEKYNLLGDPALELALPTYTLEVTMQDGSGEGWEIVATVPEKGFSGRAIVDWIGDEESVIHTEELKVRDAKLTAGYRPADGKDTVKSVRVYVWNEKAGRDCIGVLDLRVDSDSGQ